MIPYFDIPTLHLGPLEIHAFGVLVAIGILLGADRTRQRARQLGLPDAATASMATWVVVSGFVVAHVFDVLAYQPDALGERSLPQVLLLLVDPRAGLSSFGGFLGALLAFLWFTRPGKLPRLAAADSLLYGLVFGWLFGRLGCFTAHDHKGAFTTFFLGVRYPEGVRHDLGFDEALLALVLVVAFALLARRRRPVGLYGAIACLAYGPVRFGLDFLRVRPGELPGADPRYLGLTPAQYGSILVFFVGIALAITTWRRVRAAASVAAPAVESERLPPVGDRRPAS